MRTLSLDQAAACLSRGEAVVLPTDTVYGVGVAVAAASGPDVLFAAKHRPADKPVAWLVASPSDLDRYGCAVPTYARQLAAAFWPGALTLVVNASAAVPRAFQSQQGTIGLRMPASPAALALIRAAGCPLAVTSANLSGGPDAHCLDELDPALVAATAGVYVPAAGNGPTGRPASEPIPSRAEAPSHGCATDAPAFPAPASTVLDCTADAPCLLRAGALTFDQLKGAPL